MPIFVILGEASFMLYMIHWPLQQYLGAGVWTALLAIGLSIVLHLGFEKPVQSFVLRLRRVA